MKRNLLVLSLLMIFLFVSVPLMYSALTGVILGKITDKDGTPLPGVKVTISGPSLQGVREDFTNESGVFRIPELPPGEYTIKAELEGMKPVEKKGIRVYINKTTKITLKMEIKPYEQTVEVTAEAPVMDVTTSTQAVNIDKDFMEKLASGGLSYQDAVTLVGGVVGGGNPQVHGGTKMDNVYLMDGVDTTDSLTGTFGSNINEDAIEEVEIQTGGFQAEYGRALGGIVNAITKSGGNNFSGSLRVEYENNQWEETSFYSRQEPEKRTLWIPTLTFGGPIVKDKLWFFITGRYIKESDSIKAITGPYDDPQNPSGKVDTGSEWLFPYAKLTFQPTVSHKFVLKYNAEDTVIHGDNASTGRTESATSKQEQGGPFWGFEWTWLFSQDSFLSVQASMLNGFLDVVPENDDFSAVGYHDAEEGIYWGGAGDYRKNERNRADFIISYSQYLDEWIKGSHDMKFGFEYQLMEVVRETGYTGGMFMSYNNYQQGKDKYGWDKDYYYDEKTVVSGGKSSTYKGDYYALYAQDSWELQDGLTLNLGVRMEYTVYQNDTGRVKAETLNTKDYTNKITTQDNAGKFFMPAPRLGLAWDIGNEGKRKLSVFLGRYYNPLDLQIPGMLLEKSTEYAYYRRKLADDADRGNYEDRKYEWDDWRFYESYGGEENVNTLDPDLKPEHSDEFQIGYEQQVHQNVAVGLTFTYRHTTNIVEDAGIFYEYDKNTNEWTGRAYYAWDLPENWQDHPDYYYDLDHYYVTNPPGAKRNYYGLELTVKANVGRFNLLAAYTYAQAKGVVYGDQPMVAGAYSATGGVTHFSVYYDTYDLSKNLYGRLPYDIDHYFKIHATYDFFPNTWYAFSLGVSYFSRNGYAYDRLTYEPYYGGTYSTAKYGRGTYRLPQVSFMDMSIQKHFPFGKDAKYGTLSVILDINNVFSSEYLLSRNNQDPGNRKPWAFDSNGAHASPRSYHLSVKYAF